MIFTLVRAWQFFHKLVFVLVLLIGSSSLAKAEEIKVADPLETINRAIFIFNDALDKALIEPIAKVYSSLPKSARTAVRNFLRNLETPVILANNLLQADLEAAQVTTIRFTVNTTIGMLGLFDPAEKMGLPRRDEDFGQTLGTYGFGPGIYLVLPLLGPSTTRDIIGLSVDQFLDPLQYLARNTDTNWTAPSRTAVRGIDARAQHIGTIKELKRTSIDYYATLRSLYMQRRQSQIRNGSTPKLPSLELEEEDKPGDESKELNTIGKPVIDLFEQLRN